jgi:hypothetical protein
MFDPDADLGACLIAGIRPARERQVNVRVVTLHWVAELSVFSRSIPATCSTP